MYPDSEECFRGYKSIQQFIRGIAEKRGPANFGENNSHAFMITGGSGDGGPLLLPGDPAIHIF